MRFVSLGSGSSGNCELVTYKYTNILIDCGLSLKRISESLKQYDLNIENIDALFITHEHSDHIASLHNIIKNYDLKIYGEEKTLKKILCMYSEKGKLANERIFEKLSNNMFIVRDSVCYRIKDIIVKPFETYHDVPSMCYSFSLGNEVFTIMTDTGMVTDYMLNILRESNFLMIESNYDENMLKQYPKYPQFLKERILSNRGHLSNIDCANVLNKIISPKLKVACLSHISDNSNTYDLAYNTVVNELCKNKVEQNLLPKIIVAKREEITEVFV